MPVKIPDADIPAALKPWVAMEDQLPTEVVPPCYIDFRAIDDLQSYHPGFSGTISQSFKHVAMLDETTGQAFVMSDIDSLSLNWHEKMVDVISKVRLFPTSINGVAALVDNAIGSIDTPLMHGWKVTKWTVVNNKDTSLTLVHQDILEWQKGGLPPVQSIFSWRPYLPAADGAIVVPAAKLHEALRGRRFLVV
jgi:hypothetical protein